MQSTKQYMTEVSETANSCPVVNRLTEVGSYCIICVAFLDRIGFLKPIDVRWWWNRQTRTLEGRMGRPVRVQVPLTAPNCLNNELCMFSKYLDTQGFFHGDVSGLKLRTCLL